MPRAHDDGHPIEFRSDNAAGVSPQIMQAVIDANQGSALAYGGDDLSAALQARVRELFGCADATVYPVTTGTAANALGLTALCPPWGAVLCHETAHILRSECGSTSMLGGGAVMRGLPGDNFLLHADSLDAAFADTRWGDPHHSQPAVVSVTQPTDYGTVYSLEALRSLTAAARGRGLRMHLDGARLANAIVSLGCTPAEATTGVGIDVFSLGATKNGALSTDAIVCCNPAYDEELLYRTKRSGHVASKMRFQSAQLLAYLDGDLWLRQATAANDAMSALAAGLRDRGVEFVAEPDANMVFAYVDPDLAERLAASGVLFYTSPGTIRLVTSFQTTDDDVTLFLQRYDAAGH